MKFLLTSSGITNDAIAKALADLAGRPLPELSLIHIPTAANTEEGDKDWIINDLIALQGQHFKSIDILDVAAVPSEIWKPRLEAADIISFGGGNEQYLAKVLGDIGMKDFLLSVLDTKVYMGISAGSMVTGKYLPRDLLKIVYPEEDFGDTLESPMGFCDFSFVPHLHSEWFTHVTKDTLESLKDQFTHSVYATDDQTALSITNGVVQIVGTGEHWTFLKS